MQTKNMEPTKKNVTLVLVKTYIRELEKRVKMGVFLVYAFVTTLVYQTVIEYFDVFISSQAPRTYATVLILFITAGVLFGMIKHMHMPLRKFGFNLLRWKKGLRESLIWTGLFLAAVTLVKYILITQVTKFQNIPLLDLTAVTHIPDFTFATHGIAQWLIPLGLYVLFAPVQEFIVQGAFQAPILRFLMGRHRAIFSIILADLLMASLHVDLSFQYALAVLIPGLMWAVMYVRQHSLLGVSVSHVLTGAWCLWFLGIDRLLGLAVLPT